MSTISPEDSRAFAERVKSSGGFWVEAPVLGNWMVAEKAGLQIMVGCEEALFEKYKGIFSCFGTPRYMGSVGAATATKLANNFILGANIAAFAESYAYLEKSGVKLDTFMSILTNGPFNLSGGYFTIWADKFKNRSYDNNITFAANGLEKDVALALSEFKKVGIHTGAAEGIHKLVHDAVYSQNVGEKDFSAIYEGVNPRPKS